MPSGDENRVVFADGVGRQDGPFLTTLPGRLSGWGGGRIPHRRRDFGACPRRESSDGVSVRAFGWGFGVCLRREPSDGASGSGAAPVSGGEVKKSAAVPF